MGHWRSLFKLIPFLNKYRFILAAGISGIILTSVLSTPVPYLSGYVVDKVFIGHGSVKELFSYVAVIAILYLLNYVVSLLAKTLFVKINNSIVNEIRYSVISKVMDLPMTYLANTEKGYIQERISECNAVGRVFSPDIINLVLSVIGAVFSMITMFIINGKLALIVLFLTPIFFYLSKISAGGFMNSTKDMLESNAILNGECFEIMNGIEDIKILGGKAKHLAQFTAKIAALVSSSTRQSRSIILFVENIDLINNVGTALILLGSGLLILQGQFTVGLYTSFTFYSQRVFASTQGMAILSTMLRPVCLSIERIYELLEMKDENDTHGTALDSPIRTIECRDVAFQYKDNLSYVFRDLSCVLQPGDKLLLEGENGSGKTTFVKLLLRLYQPTLGAILVNGKDISSIASQSLRRRIGVVSQHIFLFRGTVLDNILYGNESKSREDVEELISHFGVQNYIGRLANGLDTEISQNTAGVSGGQAQMIAFLRAFLSDKDVIILDEPISNVDVEARELILNIIKTQSYSGIMIIISHQAEGLSFINKRLRLETLKAGEKLDTVRMEVAKREETE